MKAFELRQKRAGLAAEARAIVNKCHAETRDMSAEEKTAFDDLMAKVTKMAAEIQQLESLEEVETDVNSARGRQGGELRSDPLPDMDGKHKYSLMKVIRSIAKLGALDGLEAEMNQELARRCGHQAKGVFIPPSLATHRGMAGGAETRDLTTATGTGGIANILGTDLIQLLRNKMLTRKLGARVLSDMTGGTFSLPKQTGAATTYWITEGNAPATSNQSIGQVTFTPRTVGAITDLSRRFMLQTGLDAEAFVRDDLTQQLAIEMDRAGINGQASGNTAEPLGILQNSNVPTVALGVNGAAPTWAAMVNMETQVGLANADLGKLAYLWSVAARGRLKQTLKDTNTYGIYLWQDNEVNGYTAEATNQIPATMTKGTGTGLTGGIFGNWDSMVYAMWGPLDILEDPYTKSSSGGLRLVALQDLDIQLRYAASFAKLMDMTP